MLSFHNFFVFSFVHVTFLGLPHYFAINKVFYSIRLNCCRRIKRLQLPIIFFSIQKLCDIHISAIAKDFEIWSVVVNWAVRRWQLNNFFFFILLNWELHERILPIRFILMNCGPFRLQFFRWVCAKTWYFLKNANLFGSFSDCDIIDLITFRWCLSIDRLLLLLLLLFLEGFVQEIFQIVLSILLHSYNNLSLFCYLFKFGAWQ